MKIKKFQKSLKSHDNEGRISQHSPYTSTLKEKTRLSIYPRAPHPLTPAGSKKTRRAPPAARTARTCAFQLTKVYIAALLPNRERTTGRVSTQSIQMGHLSEEFQKAHSIERERESTCLRRLLSRTKLFRNWNRVWTPPAKSRVASSSPKSVAQSPTARLEQSLKSVARQCPINTQRLAKALK